MWNYLDKRGGLISHTILWLLIGLFTISQNINDLGILNGVITALYSLALQAICFYIAYFALTYALRVRSTHVFVWFYLGLLVAFVFLNEISVTDAHYVYPHWVSYILSSVLWTFLYIYAGHLVWSKHAVNTEKRMNDLERERLTNELQFLKAKINPHFLFNSLNNIYSLAIQQDKMAAPTIAKLSNLMRYTLSDCDSARVPLIKEFDFIREYVGMRLITSRSDWNVDIYFEEEDKVSQIAPLILINFVENAFKHSDIDRNPNGWISISGHVEDDVLMFTVSNSFTPNLPKLTSQDAKRKREGIANARRQLELNYPKNHELEIRSEAKAFKVKLQINLK